MIATSTIADAVFTDAAATKRFLAECLARLRIHRRLLCAGVKCLYAVCAEIPTRASSTTAAPGSRADGSHAPARGSLDDLDDGAVPFAQLTQRECHSLALGRPVGDYLSYPHTLRALGQLAAPELGRAIAGCIDAMEALDRDAVVLREVASLPERTNAVDRPPWSVGAELDELRAVAGDLARLAEGPLPNTDTPDNPVRQPAVLLGDSTVRSGSSLAGRRRLVLAAAQAAGHRSRLQTPFDRLRVRAVHTIDVVLRRLLVPPASLPLYEIAYYGNESARALQASMSGHPRSVLKMALGRPQRFLGDACGAAGEEGTLSARLPDTSIAYLLHLECGRLINMHDWMCAFAAVVAAQPPSKKPSKRRSSHAQHDAIDETLQARFARAVSELQLMGFIKATERKTDHVTRLTFGSV